jgi:hypothetical protein
MAIPAPGPKRTRRSTPKPGTVWSMVCMIATLLHVTPPWPPSLLMDGPRSAPWCCVRPTAPAADSRSTPTCTPLRTQSQARGRRACLGPTLALANLAAGRCRNCPTAREIRIELDWIKSNRNRLQSRHSGGVRALSVRSIVRSVHQFGMDGDNCLGSAQQNGRHDVLTDGRSPPFNGKHMGLTRITPKTLTSILDDLPLVKTLPRQTLNRGLTGCRRQTP